MLKIKQLVLGLFQQKGTVMPAPPELEREPEDINDKSMDQSRCVLFSTSKSVQSKYELTGEPITIFCQNLPTYLGGRHDLWQRANGKVGVIDETGKTPDQNELFPCEQTESDHVLEFSTFYSALGLV